ncbi:MAG: CHAT domain-containing protein [Magnetococcus sp. YQC-9]
MLRLLIALFGLLCALAHPVHAEPVVTHPDYDFAPTVSADGRWLAFVSNRAGNRDIWLQEITPGNAGLLRQLTDHPTADEQPTLDPTGARLLYVSHEQDPRGDIVLMDVKTKAKELLTDRTFGEQAPLWLPDGKGFLYTRLATADHPLAVMQRSLDPPEARVLLEGANGCTPTVKSWFVCSREGRLIAWRPGEKGAAEKGGTGQTIKNLTLGPDWDLEPRFLPPDRLIFTRVPPEDDSRSSLWLARFDPENGLSGFYRLTPEGDAPRHPSVAEETVCFGDARDGEIHRLRIPALLADYADAGKARDKAFGLLASGKTGEGMRILENLFLNPERIQPADRQAFDLEYLDLLIEVEAYPRAMAVVERYREAKGAEGAQAAVQAIAVPIQAEFSQLGQEEGRARVEKGLEAIEALARRYPNDESVRGATRIAASRLLLLLGDSSAALARLAGVESIRDRDVRVRLLFAQARVLERLRERDGVQRRLLEVLDGVGERHRWGERAVGWLVASSEEGLKFPRQIDALRVLIGEHPKIGRLKVVALRRIATLYQENGDEERAVSALDELLTLDALTTKERARTLEWKAERLIRLEAYDRAAETFAELGGLKELPEVEVKRVERLQIRQRVRAALRLQELGDPKVAQKRLAALIIDRPESVEAHRAYIATKVKLSGAAPVIARYEAWLKEQPIDPLRRYAHALALTYGETLDYERLIAILEAVVNEVPDVAAYRQTLAWVHEQFERSGKGERGHLEKALQGYQAALRLTDVANAPQEEADLLLNIGHVHHAMRNHGEALRYWQRWLQKKRPLADPLAQALLYRKMGESAFKTERSQDAALYYRQALDLLPEDPSKALVRLELIERLALAHQTLGEHARAAQGFAKALERNLAENRTDNLALLQRNIAFNLHQATRPADTPEEAPVDREAVRAALAAYLRSLEWLEKHGKAERPPEKGWISLQLALGENGSQAALGFDRHGEEKLLFGLVATLHQALGSTEAAIAELEKKKGLLAAGGLLEGGSQKAELAVLTNRLAVLYSRMGARQRAWEESLESLALTEALRQPAGMRANLYNLSKIAVERIVAGEPNDPEWGGLLAERLSAHDWEQTQPKLAFHTLANAAFILAQPIEEARFVLKGAKGDEAARFASWHRWLQARTQADLFYRRAEQLLHADKGFGARELWSHQFKIKLNRYLIALEAGKREAAVERQKEIETLSAAGLVEGGWILALIEAEGSRDPKARAEHVERAARGALELIPPLHPVGAGRILAPFYERLMALRVETLVAEGRIEAAFAASEQLERQRLALLLNDRLGREFFFNSLKTDRARIEALLRDLEQALTSRKRAGIENARRAWREATAELAASHPHVMGWLAPAEPQASAYAAASPSRPYLRRLSGWAGEHLFVVTGEKRIRHIRLNAKEEGSVENLPGDSGGPVEWLHLAAADGLPPEISAQLATKGPWVRVNGLADLVAEDERRGIWTHRVATSGPSPFDIHALPGDPPRLSIELSTAAEGEFPRQIQRAQVVMSRLPLASLALPVPGREGDVERVPLNRLQLAEGHTALLVVAKGEMEGETERTLLEAALRQAGFAHAILVDGREPEAVIHRVWRDYLLRLEQMPAVMALEAAWRASGERRANPFRFAGLAGWDGDQAARRLQVELSEAERLQKVGEIEAAALRLENGVALAKRAKREGEMAPLLSRAVTLWSGLGEEGRAVVLQERLLARLHASGGVAEGDLARAHHQLGVILTRLERFDAAMPHLEQALRLWAGAKEAGSGHQAEGRVALGVLEENRAAPNAALQHFQLALDLDQRRGDSRAMAEHQLRLGRIHLTRLYHPEQALQAFGQAFALFEAARDRAGQVRAKLASVQAQVAGGNLEAAQQELDAARRLVEDGARTKAGSGELLRAEVALQAAELAWYRGGYQEALQALDLAESLAGQEVEPRLAIRMANSRGLIYWSLNEADLALRHLDGAIELAKKRHLNDELAVSCNNRGLVLRQGGEWTAALEAFQLALRLDEARLDLYGQAYGWRNIGITRMRMKQLPEAEAALRQAGALGEKTGDRIGLVKVWLAQAQLAQAQGKADEALALFERVDGKSDQMGLAEVRWRALNGSAGIRQARGEKAEALKLRSEALRVVEALRAPLAIDTLRHGFLEDKQELYRDLIVLLVDQGQERAAFDLLERSRSGDFKDLLVSGSGVADRPEDAALLKRVNGLFKEVEGQARALAALKGTEERLWADYRRKRADAEEALLGLQLKSPALAARVTVAPVTLERLEKILPVDVGVVTYFIAEKELYIWLVRAAKTEFKRVPVGEARLEEALRRYRDGMQNQSRVESVLSQLYGWLIEPVADGLSELRYLGIIPHRALHFLAFAALRGPDGWLIDRLPLFHVPSAALLERELIRPVADKRRQGRVLAIGNPDLGEADFDLAMAEFEAESVRGNFNEGDLLKGRKATKGWIMAHIGDYSVIHIAAHGDFQNINPLFSSLWLASGEGKPAGKGVVAESGRLTAREVAALPIRADLVTLSACQTGLGQLRGSELLGLNRAFLYAGTRSLLASLWRVDDLATALLMKHFYRYYGSMAKADALRQAQLMVRQSQAHPANWAGFGLVGDYR